MFPISAKNTLEYILKDQSISPLSSTNSSDSCDMSQLPSHSFDKAIFYTRDGYCEGHILSENSGICQVRFYRNEYGNTIDNIQNISLFYKVTPQRKNIDPIFIYVHARQDKRIDGNRFIKAQYPIDIGYGIGSGINGQMFSESQNDEKYPIYTPLTFHSVGHKKTLIRASQAIIDIINNYLQFALIQQDSIDRALWLLNVTLYIDAFPNIINSALLEALTNFIHDYLSFPSGTILRQPINYILDIIGIDGICCDDDLPHKGFSSISFIPTDFEGVVYHTNNHSVNLSKI